MFIGDLSIQKGSRFLLANLSTNDHRQRAFLTLRNLVESLPFSSGANTFDSLPRPILPSVSSTLAWLESSGLPFV